MNNHFACLLQALQIIYRKKKMDNSFQSAKFVAVSKNSSDEMLYFTGNDLIIIICSA